MKLNSVLTLLFIALFTACKGGAYDLSGYGLKPDTIIGKTKSTNFPNEKYKKRRSNTL